MSAGMGYVGLLDSAIFYVKILDCERRERNKRMEL